MPELLCKLDGPSPKEPQLDEGGNFFMKATVKQRKERKERHAKRPRKTRKTLEDAYRQVFFGPPPIRQ